nr:MAG TPA: hypothetical protein [Caudoviricetes sp.]
MVLVKVPPFSLYNTIIVNKMNRLTYFVLCCVIRRYILLYFALVGYKTYLYLYVFNM